VHFACPGATQPWPISDTSMILHHYPTGAYVSASLELFASVALLFYYILRFAIQMSGNSRD
jgi:FtsH-binding integral membrane protein